MIDLRSEIRTALTNAGREDIAAKVEHLDDDQIGEGFEYMVDHITHMLDHEGWD